MRIFRNLTILFFLGSLLCGCASTRYAKEFTDCDQDCPTMQVVEGGDYHIGKPGSRLERDVQISKFAIASSNVAAQQFRRFVEETGYDIQRCAPVSSYKATWRDARRGRPDNSSVTCISWLDAQAYIAWLGKMTGFQYRLPSESEWEYATYLSNPDLFTSAKCDGKPEDGVANNGAQVCDRLMRAHAGAGEAQKSTFSMKDALGDVMQWTDDCVHIDPDGAPTDGSPWLEVVKKKHHLESGVVEVSMVGAATDCTFRKLRGTSYTDYDSYKFDPYNKFDQSVIRHSEKFGFRVARDIQWWH